MKSTFLFVGCFIFLGAALYLGLAILPGADRNVAIAEASGIGQSEVLVPRQNYAKADIVPVADFIWRHLPKTENADLYIRRRDFDAKSHAYMAMLEDQSAGKPVRADRVISLSDPRYPVQIIRPGFRAMSVSLMKSGYLADVLQPGNRIDLLVKLQNRQLEVLDPRPLTGLVGSNIRLIGKPKVRAKLQKADQTNNHDLYVLEIPEAQIELVSLAQALGSLTALLRSNETRGSHLPLLSLSDLRAFSQRPMSLVDDEERLFQSVVIQRGREMSIHESAVPQYRGKAEDGSYSNAKGGGKG